MSELGDAFTGPGFTPFPTPHGDACLCGHDVKTHELVELEFYTVEDPETNSSYTRLRWRMKCHGVHMVAAFGDRAAPCVCTSYKLPEASAS